MNRLSANSTLHTDAHASTVHNRKPRQARAGEPGRYV